MSWFGIRIIDNSIISMIRIITIYKLLYFVLVHMKAAVCGAYNL